jgi:signal transduction histidine kinase
LVGRMAHEMRNPLNSIRLSLQMLAQRQEQKRLQAGDFQMVMDEVDRMNGLLSDLLTFQQPRPANIQPRAVGPLLEECTQLVRPQAGKQGVDLVLAIHTARPTLMDEQYFRQIVVNLILNAIDVSRRGDQIDIQATATDGRVAVEISDHGPGLTPEQQEHLFEPFYTTKTNGHGLGLAVSRELAESMGASLFYGNAAGQGTTFVLQMKGMDG